jgi:tRNA-(ms[2]io[6]A)-hydroxylase
MRILSENLLDKDPKLARFYRGLLACEARHHQIYLDLIKGIYTNEQIQQRMEEISTFEQSIVDIPGEHPRMHS